MQQFRQQQTRDASSEVTFTPFIKNGMVGYICEREGSEPEFLYFNPSDDSDDGQANVFAYHGTSGHPMDDTPVCYFDVFKED